jgi:hypothetical protein
MHTAPGNEEAHPGCRENASRLHHSGSTANHYVDLGVPVLNTSISLMYAKPEMPCMGELSYSRMSLILYLPSKICCGI